MQSIYHSACWALLFCLTFKHTTAQVVLLLWPLQWLWSWLWRRLHTMCFCSVAHSRRLIIIIIIIIAAAAVLLTWRGAWLLLQHLLPSAALVNKNSSNSSSSWWWEMQLKVMRKREATFAWRQSGRPPSENVLNTCQKIITLQFLRPSKTVVTTGYIQ